MLVAVAASAIQPSNVQLQDAAKSVPALLTV